MMTIGKRFTALAELFARITVLTFGLGMLFTSSSELRRYFTPE